MRIQHMALALLLISMLLLPSIVASDELVMRSLSTSRHDGTTTNRRRRAKSKSIKTSKSSSQKSATKSSKSKSDKSQSSSQKDSKNQSISSRDGSKTTPEKDESKRSHASATKTTRPAGSPDTKSDPSSNDSSSDTESKESENKSESRQSSNEEIESTEQDSASIHDEASTEETRSSPTDDSDEPSTDKPSDSDGDNSEDKSKTMHRPSIPSIYSEDVVSSISRDSEDVVRSPDSKDVLVPIDSEDVVTSDNVFDRDGGCLVNADGMFGSASGVEQVLDFYYQVELLPMNGNKKEEVLDALAKVESSVSKTLLPSLFVDECALTARLQASHQGSYRRRRRLVEMMGISTLPVDQVLEGVKCTGELTYESSECRVVDGRLTLYATSTIDEASLTKVRSFIHVAMAKGDFDAIDSRLVSVSYRERTERDRDSSIVGSSNETEESGTTMPFWAIMILTVVIVGVLVSLLLYFASRGL